MLNCIWAEIHIFMACKAIPMIAFCTSLNSRASPLLEYETKGWEKVWSTAHLPLPHPKKVWTQD